jgi:uncharacterized protein (DUF2141 family)
MTTKSKSMLVVATLAAVVVAGCSADVPDGKVRVKGAVLKGGAPLAIVPPATGGLNFTAQEGTEAQSATIDAKGEFSVILSPGTYAVSVMAKDGVDTMDENGKQILAKNLVDRKYESTATSGLEVTVTSDGAPVTIEVE